MANTYTQLYIHLVFSPKNRDSLIKKAWKADLEKYITGVVQKQNHKLLAIGSMPDHNHIFIGYNVNQTIPDLVENIKTSSNAWIKEQKHKAVKVKIKKKFRKNAPPCCNPKTLPEIEKGTKPDDGVRPSFE